MAEQHAHSYLQTHQMSGDVLRFALWDETNVVQEQATLSPEGRASKTLLKEGPLRLTLVAMRKGSSMDQHVSPGPCTIQALRGRFHFKASSGECDLGPGDIVALDKQTVHSLEAIEDSVLLLTVTVPPGERAPA